MHCIASVAPHYYDAVRLIAQHVAIQHPDRVTSLTLLSTARVPTPPSQAKIRTVIKAMQLMRPEVPDADAEGERWVRLIHLVGTHPIDEEHWRDAGRVAHQRGIDPAGSKRHTIAAMGAATCGPGSRG
jgi:pimeloyl-ACP methyl ester carboxylesterase